MEVKQWKNVLSAKEEHTITGNIEIVEDFNMPQLERTRRVWIYLPPDYETTVRDYPVLYMHDGQNLFDEATANYGEWEIDETIEQLFNEGQTAGVIVVGIDCHPSKRRNEYSPWQHQEENLGGAGAEYVEFLVETLKPYIDQNYRTLKDRDHTAIAGSSMGGFISLYAGFKYQTVFSKIGAFSPALFFNPQQMNQFLKDKGKTEKMKVYIDVGTKETLDLDYLDYLITADDYLADVKQTAAVLENIGFAKENLQLKIDKGAQHQESDWAKRFPPAFLWLFEE